MFVNKFSFNFDRFMLIIMTFKIIFLSCSLKYTIEIYI